MFHPAIVVICAIHLNGLCNINNYNNYNAFYISAKMFGELCKAQNITIL